MNAILKNYGEFQEISPPLPNVFIGNLIGEGNNFDFDDNAAAARYIVDNAISNLGGQSITGSSPENNEIISNMMVAEAKYALDRKDVHTSCNWYTDAINRMIAIMATLHPEIGSDEEAIKHPSGLFRNKDEARTVLFAAMAITSQNINVQDNMRYALEQYRSFLENGEFSPKAYGAKGVAVENNLARFNFLLERGRGDLTRMKKMLMMELPMKKLQSIAKKYGIGITTNVLSDEMVHGSMLFGPKVGNGFFQNLMGNHKPVTIDLWFMRMWGRYTGTLVKDEMTGDSFDRLVQGMRKSMASSRMKEFLEGEGLARTTKELENMDAPELFSYCKKLKRSWEKLRKRYVEGKLSNNYSSIASPKKDKPSNSIVSEFKAKLMWPAAADSIMDGLGMPVDSPKSGTQRRWISNTVNQAINKLNDLGYKMSAADLQAILWYPEKEIYGKMTNRTLERFNTSYDEAVLAIAKKAGIDNDKLITAIESVGTEKIDRLYKILDIENEINTSLSM